MRGQEGGNGLYLLNSLSSGKKKNWKEAVGWLPGDHQLELNRTHANQEKFRL